MEKVTVRYIPEHLMPDVNYQFVEHDNVRLVLDNSKPIPLDRELVASDFVRPELDEWFLYDSWGVKLACKLITLGYPVDLDIMAEEVKGWPRVCSGRDRFYAMVTVYDRALGIAASSVKAGTIKEHDTPANWCKWATSKGYSVAHLPPADAPAKIEATTVAKRVPVLEQQEKAILEWLKSNGYDPLKSPVPPKGKPGVRKKCKSEMVKSMSLFISDGVFYTAWERLRANGEIKDAT